MVCILDKAGNGTGRSCVWHSGRIAQTPSAAGTAAGIRQRAYTHANRVLFVRQMRINTSGSTEGCRTASPTPRQTWSLTMSTAKLVKTCLAKWRLPSLTSNVFPLVFTALRLDSTRIYLMQLFTPCQSGKFDLVHASADHECGAPHGQGWQEARQAYPAPPWAKCPIVFDYISL